MTPVAVGLPWFAKPGVAEGAAPPPPMPPSALSLPEALSLKKPPESAAQAAIPHATTAPAKLPQPVHFARAMHDDDSIRRASFARSWKPRNARPIAIVRARPVCHPHGRAVMGEAVAPFGGTPGI